MGLQLLAECGQHISVTAMYSVTWDCDVQNTVCPQKNCQFEKKLISFIMLA